MHCFRCKPILINCGHNCAYAFLSNHFNVQLFVNRSLKAETVWVPVIFGILTGLTVARRQHRLLLFRTARAVSCFQAPWSGVHATEYSRVDHPQKSKLGSCWSRSRTKIVELMAVNLRWDFDLILMLWIVADGSFERLQKPSFDIWIGSNRAPSAPEKEVLPVCDHHCSVVRAFF